MSGRILEDGLTRSDFQVFKLQITNLTVCYMKTIRSHYLVTVDNSIWQPLHCVVSLSTSYSSQCSDFTFKCALTSFGSRSGSAEYTFPFFDRMGSIDLLNSSSSIIILVSDFSFSSPMLFSETGRRCTESSWWRCALRCAPDWAPPRPVWKAARRGAEETQQAQSHIPGTFQELSDDWHYCAVHWLPVMSHGDQRVLRV